MLQRRLTDVVGDEEAVSEMLSNFPDDERLRPATEAYVDSAVADLRAEMHKQTTQLIVWMIGTAIALAAVTVTAVGFWA